MSSENLPAVPAVPSLRQSWEDEHGDMEDTRQGRGVSAVSCSEEG